MSNTLTDFLQEGVYCSLFDHDGCYNKNLVRSPHRTSHIHQRFATWLFQAIPTLSSTHDVRYEYRIVDVHGKRFKLDIVFENKQTKEIDVVILFKFVLTDYNRNRNNYQNISLGETVRIVGGNWKNQKHPHILFVNVLPKVEAHYNKGGTLLRYNTVNHVDIQKGIDLIVREPSRVVRSLNIVYDLSVVAVDAKCTQSKKGFNNKARGAVLMSKEKFALAFEKNKKLTYEEENTTQCIEQALRG